MHIVADTHDTETRAFCGSDVSGVDETDHEVPFQVSARVEELAPLIESLESPTATQNDAEVHETADSSLKEVELPAPGTTTLLVDHDVPFHVSAKASWPTEPTAMQKLLLTHDTPIRLTGPEPPDGAAEVEAVHELPFQSCITGVLDVVVNEEPTDAQKLALGHETDVRKVLGVVLVGVVLTVALVEAPAGSTPAIGSVTRLAVATSATRTAMRARGEKSVATARRPPSAQRVNDAIAGA